ncbi:MAG TPA: putative glycoside hydrolase [Firmicutes bacterium]|nr:putative glycoside hydrolase [Bacillota bacterium]
MWKKTRLYVFLFVLFVFSVRIFSSSGTKSTGFLMNYETLFPQLLAKTAVNPPPAIPPRVEPTPEPEPPFVRVTPTPMPEEVRGVYATGWVAGTPSLFNNLLRFIDATPVNSLVIDIKDDTGKVSYRSTVPMVNLLGAWENKIPDVQNMLQTLQQKKVYPIARLVVFKDPFLAEKRPDLALKQRNGEVWRDYKGLAWVDPHAREVWDYNIQIAKEAVKMGFPEIQFDYVRFASDGDLRNCVYPYADGSSKEDVIRDFLLYARAELEPLGAVVSADIFGLVCSAADDLYIGQKLEKIAEAVPVISPMVYPSHYAKGCYGLADPDRRPYETVLRSLQDARQRLKDYPVKLRPWLQDFSLGNTYGPVQIQAQIRAVYDAGVREWLFWNPSCRYNVDKYVTNKNSEPITTNVLPGGEGVLAPVVGETPSSADAIPDAETDETVAWAGEPAAEEGLASGEGALLPPVVLGLTEEWQEEEDEEEDLAFSGPRTDEETAETAGGKEHLPDGGEEAGETPAAPEESGGAGEQVDNQTGPTEPLESDGQLKQE